MATILYNNMFIPYQSNDRVGQVNFLGSQSATYLGTGDGMTGPYGVAVDNINGNIWFTSNSGNKVGRLDTTSIAALQQSYNVDTSPTGICVDKNGDAWCANNGSYVPTTVSKLNKDNANSTNFKLTLGTSPNGMCCDDNGDIWVALESSDVVVRLKEFQINAIDNNNYPDSSGISGDIDGINCVFTIPNNDIALRSDDKIEIAVDESYAVSGLPTAYSEFNVVSATPASGQVWVENDQPSAGSSRITFFSGVAANAITTTYSNGQVTCTYDDASNSYNGNTLQVNVNTPIDNTPNGAKVNISGTASNIYIDITPDALLSGATPFSATSLRDLITDPSVETNWALQTGAETSFLNGITATGGNITDILAPSNNETITFAGGQNIECPASDLTVKFIEQLGVNVSPAAGPRGVIADENDKLWVANPGDDTVNMIDIATQAIDWTAAGSGSDWDGISFGCPTPDGNCVFVSGNSNSVMKLSNVDGSEIWRKTSSTHSINSPRSASLDRNQNLWIVNSGNNSLTKLAANGDQLATYDMSAFGTTPSAVGDFTGYVYEVILNNYDWPSGNINPEKPTLRAPMTPQIQSSLTAPVIFEINNDPENSTQQLSIERDTSSAFPSQTVHDSWGSSINYDATISWAYSLDWVPGQATTSGTWTALGSGDPGPSGVPGQDGVLEGTYIRASVHLPTYGDYFLRAKSYDGSNFSPVASNYAEYKALDSLVLDGIIPSTKSYDQTISAKVSGENFTTSTSVGIGGTVLSSVYVSVNEIEVSLPNTLYIGSHDVVASDPGYLPATIVDGFTVTSPGQEVPCQLTSPIDFTFVDVSSANFDMIWYSVVSPQGGTAQFRVEIDTQSDFLSQSGISPLYKFATGSGMLDYEVGNAMEYSLNYDPVLSTGNWAPSGEQEPSINGVAGVNGSPADESCFNKVNRTTFNAGTYYWRVREWTGERLVNGDPVFNDWSTTKIFIVGKPSSFNEVVETTNRVVKKDGRIIESYRKDLYQ